MTLTDILDNVVPFIDGEEEKLEKETRKILGKVEKANGEERFVPLQIRMSAHTNRVPVLDGHTISFLLLVLSFPFSPFFFSPRFILKNKI